MIKHIVIPTVLLLSICFSAFAQVYKTVDDQGNVTYSDQTQNDSQTMELPRSNTVPAIEVPKKITADESDSPETSILYKSIKITSPADDTGFGHGPGNFTVSISTSPALGKNDKIRLLMDGKTHSEGSSTEFKLSNITRGSHTLQAVIISSTGKVLKKSRSITVHMMRPSVVSPSY